MHDEAKIHVSSGDTTIAFQLGGSFGRRSGKITMFYLPIAYIYIHFYLTTNKRL